MTDCPVERTAVDIERCARCPWRHDGSATCTGTDRMAASDWRSLLRILAI